MDPIAMDALSRGWQLGFGTVVPRRDVPNVRPLRAIPRPPRRGRLLISLNGPLWAEARR